MIVDDEPDILISLRSIFEKQDFDVTCVESGSKCIEELEKGFKGIILMDIMMPEMTGWDTVREILNRDLMNNIAIEIITGKGTKDHALMGELEAYIYDYLSKPFNLKMLISSVNKCSHYLDVKSHQGF